MLVQGQGDDRDEMLAQMYHELRAAAARLLQREAPYLTIQPTELVNEAAMRVMKLDRMSWNDRQHFFATSARILRQAMIDAIRKRKSQKRHAPTILMAPEQGQDAVDIETLDAALKRLETISPDMAKIVDMRFFVGMTNEEISAATDLSESTVKRRWLTAKAWLADEMRGAEPL